MRYWIFVPHALAMAISPDSFAGYHLVNLCLFWGMMVAFYAVLRQLRVAPWLAFLVTILFLAYPVNSRLMSIRSIAMTYGKLSLLAAVALSLDCRENPSRLKLLGVWLALLFNVGSYEIALVIILVMPLLWWWPAPGRRWRKLNLTVVWYLAPAVKAAYVLLLLMFNRFFYGVLAHHRLRRQRSHHAGPAGERFGARSQRLSPGILRRLGGGAAGRQPERPDRVDRRDVSSGRRRRRISGAN